MDIPYERASLTVWCTLHDVALEFYADHDAESILDKLQLGCPELSRAIYDLHRQRGKLEGEASKASLDDWRAEHPTETALYPADYVPYIAEEYWPEWAKQAAIALDIQEEDLADKDFLSWVVRLEERTKKEEEQS
jgi:hypothetical protein